MAGPPTWGRGVARLGVNVIERHLPHAPLQAASLCAAARVGGARGGAGAGAGIAQGAAPAAQNVCFCLLRAAAEQAGVQARRRQQPQQRLLLRLLPPQRRRVLLRLPGGPGAAEARAQGRLGVGVGGRRPARHSLVAAKVGGCQAQGLLQLSHGALRAGGWGLELAGGACLPHLLVSHAVPRRGERSRRVLLLLLALRRLLRQGAQRGAQEHEEHARRPAAHAGQPVSQQVVENRVGRQADACRGGREGWAETSRAQRAYCHKQRLQQEQPGLAMLQAGTAKLQSRSCKAEAARQQRAHRWPRAR